MSDPNVTDEDDSGSSETITVTPGVAWELTRKRAINELEQAHAFDSFGSLAHSGT